MVKNCGNYLIDGIPHETTMGPIYSLSTERRHSLHLTLCIPPLTMNGVTDSPSVSPVGIPLTGKNGRQDRWPASLFHNQAAQAASSKRVPCTSPRSSGH